MILYKYVTFEVGIKILTQRAIRFTQLEALNDPFESRPLINLPRVFDLYRRLIKKEASKPIIFDSRMQSIFEMAYDSQPLEQKSLVSRDFFIAFARESLSSESEEVKQARIQTAAACMEHRDFRTLRQILEFTDIQFARDYGVFSMSATPNDALMWSLYADSAKGLVLGFDAKNAYFKEMIRVRYLKRRAVVDAPRNLRSSKEKMKFAKEFFATKSERWQHEREYRLVNSVEREIPRCEDQRGYAIFLAGFPPESLIKVILGVKTTQKDINKAVDVVSHSVYANVKISRASLDLKSYRIVIRQLF